MYENEIITGSLNGEVWKAIPGYNGYLVSNEGRIYSQKRNLIMRIDHSNRYDIIQFTIEGKPKNCKVARLTASAFCVKTEEQTEVHHKDRNRRNNRANNLMWVTPHQHKAIHRELKKELKANKDRAKAGDTK